jgi:hypothetical protein
MEGVAIAKIATQARAVRLDRRIAVFIWTPP